MTKDEAIERAVAAAEKNRAAQAAANQAAQEYREAIYAALDAGNTITETYRAVGITRSRINQLIAQRK